MCIRDSSVITSLMAAYGLVYFISDSGITSIVRPGNTFEVVEENDLKERVSASAAISQGQIFIRSHQHLYCIGKVK